MQNMIRLMTGLMVVGAFLFAAGCNVDPTAKGKTAKGKEKGKPEHKHDHGELGPHGGPLADWDDVYHAEFTVDHDKQQARVYILGKDAKTPAPIKSGSVLLSVKRPPFDLELKPEKQKDDPEGTASVFVGTHQHLAKERDYEGTLSAEIDGKPYSAEFKGHGHVHK